MEAVSVSLFHTAHCKFSGTQLLIVSILCLAANIIKEDAPNQTCYVLTKILFLLKKILQTICVIRQYFRRLWSLYYVRNKFHECRNQALIYWNKFMITLQTRLFWDTLQVHKSGYEVTGVA